MKCILGGGLQLERATPAARLLHYVSALALDPALRLTAVEHVDDPVFWALVHSLTMK